MKSEAARQYADPKAAARKLMQLAKAVETIQDGRIYIVEIREPFISEHGGSPAEYDGGLKFAIERGYLHDSGKFVGVTKAGADLFA
jgi:hypothetical protein